MLVDPNGNLLKVKHEAPISREQMKMFADFERMLERMGLAYQIRCRACNAEDPRQDGCWGGAQSNSMEFVVECRCTRRAYVGADVPLHG